MTEAIAIKEKPAESLLSADEQRQKTALIGLLGHQPNNPEAHAKLGVFLHKERRYADAEKHLRRACTLAPANEALLNQLGRLYVERDQKEKYIEFVERFIQATGYSETHYYNFATLLERYNQLERAQEILDEMTEQSPESLLTLCVTIRLLERQKKLEEAVAYFEANKQHLKGDHSFIAAALFDMAKVSDKLGQYDQAIQYAVQANQLNIEYAKPRPDKQEFTNRVMALGPAMTPDMAEKLNSLSMPKGEKSPIFLFGFPRCGTTLTHQILDGHSDVVVSEEKAYAFQILYNEAARLGSFRAVFEQATPETLSRYRQMYWNMVHQDYPDALEKPYFVDKHPMHTHYVFFLKLLFPEAKMVFLQRHPFDCCLSAFFQAFRPTAPMAHFATLQDSLNLYVLFMKFWQASLQLIKMDYRYLRYESLAENPEKEAKELFEFLSIPWDESVLDVDQRAQDRYIKTASYRQVGEKIHAGATYRWHKYAKHFEPFIEPMKPCLELFDYNADLPNQ